MRKKNTETRPEKDRGRSKSSASWEHDGSPGVPMPLPVSSPVGTGVGTTNARFLKFSDAGAIAAARHGPARPSRGLRRSRAIREGYGARSRSTRSAHSSGSGGSAATGRHHGDAGREAYGMGGQLQDDYAYGRPKAADDPDGGRQWH